MIQPLAPEVREAPYRPAPVEAGVVGAPVEVDPVEVVGLLEDRLQEAVAEHLQDQRVVVSGWQVEQGRQPGPVVEGAGMVAGGHEDDRVHPGGEDRLLVPGRVPGEALRAAGAVGGVGQPAEEDLVIERGVHRLGVEEAGAVGSPPLRLVPVAVGWADAVLADQAGPVRSVGIEAGDADVRPAVLPFVGVPVERGPDDVAAVRRPVGVEVVVELAARRQVGAAAAVAPHHPDVRADAAEPRRPDPHRVIVPGVKEDPVPVRLHHGHLIGAGETAGEALLLGARRGSSETPGGHRQGFPPGRRRGASRASPGPGRACRGWT